ncbi:cytochrome P450 [Nocardia sp. NPDC059246]|uniref:cytochrome P450 n=1 Tax=Nocardia sp. NPDC059246 TaxID=3346789 RepID=UPI0036BC4292
MDPDLHAEQLYDSIQRDASFPDAVRDSVNRYWLDGRISDAFRDPEVVQALHENPLSDPPFATLMDAPGHTRLRRLLAGQFSVRRVGDYQSRIEQIVEDRLDAMEELGAPVDLVEIFAQPIPSLVTCALYGVPESERETFERLGAVRHIPGATVTDVLEANEAFRAFTSELVQRKRAHPGDDLLSTLVRSGELTDDQLVSVAILLVRAGNGTTALALTFAVATLLQDRDRWQSLRSESSPISRTVEELLRYTTIAPASDVRTALEDVELGGVVIKAFESVVVSYSAANRDPQMFAEPDRVDFARQPAQNLTFGYGVHQCLGQHLARLELQVALRGLARRYPTLELAVPATDIPWHRGDRQTYGPQRLLVTW